MLPRPSVIAGVVGLAAAIAAAGAAQAKVTVKTSVETYSISGKTGNALLDAMDVRGPKNGFMTHAIAQTAYTVSWSIDWTARAGRCRVANASAVLKIVYHYPKVTSAMTPGLRKRWDRFMRGVRQHEETHGRIARQMVDAAEEALQSIGYGNDRRCSRTKAEVKKRIAGIYAEYEARQVKFDEVEHAEGGHVEGLVSLLSRGK
jgi:predicted secreted Zn-dependent protease